MRTKFWSENLRGNVSFRKHWQRWEYNIGMDVTEIASEGVD
jgi:hypothetical protein